MTSILQILVLCGLGVLWGVKGQAPASSYLPPPSGGGYPSGGPTGSGLPSGGGTEEGGKPEPFSFSYEVKDDASGNDYSHKAEGDVNGKVTGEYQVLLPDGRKQKVSYTADESGYNADVKYEGEARPGPTGGAGPGTGAGGRGPTGTGAGAGYPAAATGYPAAGTGFPGTGAGGPTGGSAPGGGYPSGPPSRPGGSYLPPGK